MTPTKEQQAQEYAKQIQKDFIHNRLVTEELAFEDIEAAWLDGYTACEQSMWRSVEEELPQPDTICLVIGYKDMDFNGRFVRYTAMAWYDGEHWHKTVKIFGITVYHRHDYTKNNEPRPIGFNSMAPISGEIEDDDYWEDKNNKK